MNKLRDWWPSEDLLERKKSSAAPGASCSNSHISSQTTAVSPQINAISACPLSISSSPSSAAAATLRLSEVAAALNAMPSQPASLAAAASKQLNNPNPSHELLATFCTRPATKLANLKDHKEELWRKLVTSSASSRYVQSDKEHASQQSMQQAAPVHVESAGAANRIPSNVKLTAASADSADHRKRKRDARSLRSNAAIVSQVEQQGPEPGLIKNEHLTRREIHIFAERQRRKGMSHLYGILQSLLPDPKPKSDRCTVLSEAMDYIYELQMRRDELKRQKSEILASMGEHLDSSLGGLSIYGGNGRQLGGASQSGRMLAEVSEEVRDQILSAADVTVRFCGRDAFINLNSPKRKGVWSGVIQMLNEQDMELLNVTLSSSNATDYHCVHAKISADSELRSHELQQMLQDLVLSHAILD